MATAGAENTPETTTTRKRPTRTPGGKVLVILSDGTGNSASALFKTNIWRLYRALDLSEKPGRGKRRQIAYYDDGVGTSSFRPLALLGGAFGVGLKRNVLDLYRFICRNYEDGDQIYAFGFSRGAFTVRVAVGLLAMEGILKCETEEELNRYSVDAYRELRRAFTQESWSSYLTSARNKGAVGEELKSGLFVRFFRGVRDRVIAFMRHHLNQKPYSDVAAECRKRLDSIEFVGVFDTVAAYGMPIAELTRGVDEWIWPLSMPDYKLSDKVKTARHALALDDERDTFHPLVWDENEEERLVDEKLHLPGRMKQVWFSGMHSDVGGGYPDDSASEIPLLWMIGEAREQGLRFDKVAVEAIEREASAYSPLHDSRRGVGSYYRLQPRKLSARLDSPDQTALIMQDPRLSDRGMLNTIVVHESVFERIERGTDKAAPIVLPAIYKVAHYDGTIGDGPESAKNARLRADRQEWIWNLVWMRRVVYFTTVGVSILLALLPLLAKRASDGYECGGPLCFVSAAITAIGGFLPNFLDRWIDYYSAHPFCFLVFVVILVGLIIAGSSLQRRMRDDMRTLWEQSLGSGKIASDRIRHLSEDATAHWIFRLRTNGHYQRALRCLKWKIVPAVFGVILLLLILNLLAAIPIRLIAWDVCGADGGWSFLRMGAMCWLAD